MNNPIQIVEVGARDGLQNEKMILTVDQRIEFINLLSKCGFREIEVGSMVSPKWVPQMADSDLVYKGIQKRSGVDYSLLVPNMQGLEAAIAAGAKTISIFTAASEEFNKKNINCTIAESFERFQPIMARAREANLRVRGYVSCVVHCPYAGEISPDVVLDVTERLLEIGCYEVSLGDTTGQGRPETISKMLDCVLQKVQPKRLAIHCHDTNGRALDNIAVAISKGITVVDAALNGLGGCPYGGENARGNVSTQSVVRYLMDNNYAHTIDIDALFDASEWLSETTLS